MGCLGHTGKEIYLWSLKALRDDWKFGMASHDRGGEQKAPYVHIFRGDKSGGGIRPAASGSASELPSSGKDAHRPTTVPPPSGDKDNTRTPRPPTVPLPGDEHSTPRPPTVPLPGDEHSTPRPPTVPLPQN
jgi:hypothetical protein